jgi:plasmid stabilization system protein ParE
MNWNVIWIPDAEQHLATIWNKAPDRQAVADAADWNDRQLALDPQNAGESRPNLRRVLLHKPLGVTYKVLLNKGQVRVLRVWNY